MNVDIRGPWSETDIQQFLTQVRFPVRLACVAGDGFPRVVSLWYQYVEGLLLCVTHKDSHLASLLRNNARVGFEVSPNDPPYHGLRGQGRVELELVGSSNTLVELLNRYLGGTQSSLGKWLLSRTDEELLITVRPHRLFNWDYRERMADVL